jgi:capsid protein
MMLQEWDISTAERRIFSEWLKMALIMGAVPLPVAKFRKFNAVKFTGRRWAGVDAVKEGVAKAQDLANKFTSLQAIHDEQGTDLEQTLTEIAESNMLMEKFGIETATTKGPMTPPDKDEPDDDDDEPFKKKEA